MENKHEYEIANFVCKFNENNLMDLFEEIVLQAFHRKDTWKIKSGTFFFKDVQFTEYQHDSEEVLYAITGRFIRNTFLRREQYLDEQTNELIQDTKVLATSPSAFFVLILNNHRLMYLKETRHAPTLEMFRSTTETFLKRETRDYLNYLEPLSRKNFIETYGLPSLRITPLSSETKLAEFIKSYKKLETVKVTLKARNDENDHAGFIDVLQNKSDAVDSQSTNLVYENKKDGLNKEQITHQLSDLTKQGNQTIKLIGLSEKDEILKGNNENFKITQSINGLDLTNVKKSASKLMIRFIDLIKKGQITIPKTDDKVLKKLEHHSLSQTEANNKDDSSRQDKT